MEKMTIQQSNYLLPALHLQSKLVGTCLEMAEGLELFAFIIGMPEKSLEETGPYFGLEYMRSCSEVLTHISCSRLCYSYRQICV